MEKPRDNICQDLVRAKYVFAEDLAVGHQAEQALVDWFVAKGVPDYMIETAPTDKAFHDWDVKLSNMTLEVKRDRWINQTGNLCIELCSNTGIGSPGWWLKTKARKLVVFHTDAEFMLFDMERLRDDWFHNHNKWKQMLIKQASGHQTVNYLRSVLDLEFSIVSTK